MNSISNEATGVIQAELKPGEKLLWAGAPRRSFIVRPWLREDLISLGLLFCSLVFFTAQVFVFHLPPPLGKWVFPYCWLWWYWAVYNSLICPVLRRNRLIYGVTTERLIILEKGTPKLVKSLGLDSLATLRLDEKRDGSGDIIFGLPPFNPEFVFRSFRIARFPDTETIPGELVQPRSEAEAKYTRFEMVPDAKNVYNQCCGFQRAKWTSESCICPVHLMQML